MLFINLKTYIYSPRHVLIWVISLTQSFICLFCFLILGERNRADAVF